MITGEGPGRPKLSVSPKEAAEMLSVSRDFFDLHIRVCQKRVGQHSPASVSACRQAALSGTHDGDGDNVPAPKSRLLSSPPPISSLDATLLKSSSESIGFSDPNV